MKFKAYVFDAYGTLFDVHSAVSRHADEVGPNAARLSEVWRNKQLEYSWTRAGMGKYRDFWSLTKEALDFAFKATPDCNLDARAALLDAYMSLDCYREVPSVLADLKKSGVKTAILSNGSPDMLGSAIHSAGLDEHLDDAFSVDTVSTFKTMPETYKMVTNAYAIKPEEVSFQSSNRWDIAGARAFGFHCNWINRTNQPDEYGDLAPQTVLNSIEGLS